MALVKKNDVVGGSITAFNHAKGVIIMELDSGDPATLHMNHLDVDPREREARYQQLVEAAKRGDDAECELRVKVIREWQRRDGRTAYCVSERLDVPADEEPILEPDLSAVEPEPDPALVARFKRGDKVRAKYSGVRGKTVLVWLGEVPAYLPVNELNGKKESSLRSDVPIKAQVDRVDGFGVWLTCKPIPKTA